MKKNVESIFPYGAEIYNEGQINRIGLEIIYMIIPGLSEPPVRTLRATIPENESHIFRQFRATLLALLHIFPLYCKYTPLV